MKYRYRLLVFYRYIGIAKLSPSPSSTKLGWVSLNFVSSSTHHISCATTTTYPAQPPSGLVVEKLKISKTSIETIVKQLHLCPKQFSYKLGRSYLQGTPKPNFYSPIQSEYTSSNEPEPELGTAQPQLVHCFICYSLKMMHCIFLENKGILIKNGY